MEAYQNEQDFINNYFDGLKISLFKKVFLIWSLETLDTDWHKVHVVTVTESDEILSIERHEGQVVTQSGEIWAGLIRFSIFESA